MNWKKTGLPLVLAVLFTLVFYRQNLGLNLFLFDLAIGTTLLVCHRASFYKPLGKALMAAFVLSGLTVLLFNSVYSITINICLGFVVSGYVASGLQNASYIWFFQGLGNAVAHQDEFVRSLKGLKTNGGFPLKKLAIGIPISLVVLVFLGLYAQSSPWLREALSDSLGDVFEVLGRFFSTVNWGVFWCFVLGLMVANLFVYRSAKKMFEDGKASFGLQRTKDRRPNRVVRAMMALRTEYKSGLILLLLLNLLLGLVNFLDIKNIWFGFSFHGQFLKELVHEGTYALILSVVLSMCVVLYFFRGNLNFYKANKKLKLFAYIWIAQNMLLLVSVLVRNSIYIHYYALAYKRIGVFMFLIACTVGLVLLFIKVSQRKSMPFFFHYNTLSVLAILLSGCFVNWDVWIARYNMAHYKTAFLHLDYLAILSEKALPELDVSLETVEGFKLQEASYFKGFSSSVSRVSYMEPEAFYNRIQSRKESFLKDYPNRSWLEWNLADSRAYKRLKE